jgi:hypothetical protein
MYFGDVLNEPTKDFMSKISFTRESNGNNYVQFNETIKNIPQNQSLSNRWNRLELLLNQETWSASLWLNGQTIFEDLPLKPGFAPPPAVSFSIDAGSVESSASVEIDDFTVRVLNSSERENEIRFITLFTEDFESFEEGTFPVNENSGWKKIGFINRKRNQTKHPEKIEQSVLVNRDFISGLKCLKLQTIEENQVTVVKYFNIPENFPFDTSNKPFEIRCKESI